MDYMKWSEKEHAIKKYYNVTLLDRVLLNENSKPFSSTRYVFLDQESFSSEKMLPRSRFKLSDTRNRSLEIT